METFSALLAICVGNSPVPGELPRSFDVFFGLRLNKRFSKQSWGWWFETLPCPLWRHGNGLDEYTESVPISLSLHQPHKKWDVAICMPSDHLRSPTHSKEGYPDSKINGTNMGPIWGRQDPDGPHVGPMNFAIWVILLTSLEQRLINTFRLHQLTENLAPTPTSKPRNDQYIIKY